MRSGMDLFHRLLQVNGLHLLTLLVGVVGILLYIYSEISNRRNKLKYGFDVMSKGIFSIKLILISAIIAYITWISSRV